MRTLCMCKTALLAITGFLVCTPSYSGTVNERDTITLDNGKVRLMVNIHGGAIADYSFVDQGLNPLSWRQGGAQNATTTRMGHFVCFDRVGKPSETEKAKGIPSHGEATSVLWKVIDQASHENGNMYVRLECKLPIATMSLTREICLFKDSSICKVTDRIKNENKFGKLYNIMQHPCISSPFLDTSVIVDCSASTGFMNTKESETIPGPLSSWPMIESKDTQVNLRVMNDTNTMVANFISEKDNIHGWSCVSNSSRQLMLGYVWNTAEYPWIRVWRRFKKEAPYGMSIEFSTTPLAIPFGDILKVGNLLDTPTIEYLDPDIEVEKTFYMFLSKIPHDFTGVKSVSLEKNQLVIEEKDSARARQLTLEYNEEK